MGSLPEFAAASINVGFGFGTSKRAPTVNLGMAEANTKKAVTRSPLQDVW